MLFSIITVVYNDVKTVERTIKSVLNQNYNDMEYIMIDGGSTDGTVDIIRKYENRISYWVSEPDGGIYDAMNKGIMQSRGEFIYFLGADDFLEAGELNRVANDIGASCDEKLFCYDVWKVASDGKILNFDEKYIPNNYMFTHIGNQYPHQGLFAHRDLFFKYGLFSDRYKVLGDYDWLLRIYSKGIEPKWNPRKIAYYSMDGISTKESVTAILERGCALVDNYNPKNLPVSKDTGNYDMPRESLCYRSDTALIKYIDSYIYDKCDDILDKVLAGRKVIICGAGENGRGLYNFLSNAGIEVSGVWDNGLPQDFPAHTIIPEEGQKSANEVILISAFSAYEEFAMQLEKLGYIENEDFFAAGVILRPCFETR